MKLEFENKINQLESSIENINTEVPIASPTGEVDTSSLMVLINKNAAEIKNRATISDLDSLKSLISFKADQTYVKKEIQRLEEMISRLTTMVNNVQHDTDGLGKDLSELK